MVSCITNSRMTTINGKNKKSDIEIKKLITSKVSKTSKANLQRSKVPLNWNKFIDEEVDPKSKKPATKKYPKSLTQASTQIAEVSNKKGKKTAACIYSAMPGAGKCVAIDCEMVGIGYDGRESMLARVSLVDEKGSVIYDTFVKAQQRVTDYRTSVSGVRHQDMEKGREFRQVQHDVSNIIAGKLLIGHAISNDLKVLFLSHPRKLTRDTSKFKKFREESNGRTPSLKLLSSNLLDMAIQHGEHSSIEDARATMFLYMKFRNVWEKEIKSHYKK